MARAIDGTIVPDSLPAMACGGTPLFDVDSGISYRCDTCWAVIGSVGQSKRCVEINDAAEKQALQQRKNERGAWR
jgi:hypothetical protein